MINIITVIIIIIIIVVAVAVIILLLCYHQRNSPCFSFFLQGYLTLFTPMLLISVISGLIICFKLDQQILAELKQFLLAAL